VPANPGDELTMHCKITLFRPSHLRSTFILNTIADKYNDSTGKYDQSVAINGSIVSTLSTGMLTILAYSPVIDKMTNNTFTR
jgi:hypothetical protein